MSGFAESLESLGGDLFGQISELGGKYLDKETEKWRAKYMRNPTESIQPQTAMPPRLIQLKV